MKNSPSNINKSSTRLLFSYGLGDAGTGLAATQLGFHLFIFLTKWAGLPALIASSILMIIKVWDAFNDPIIGRLSDRTNTRWGPRIPWMLISSLPFSFALAAIWWIPPGDTTQKTFYYALISILLMTGYTGVNLPYAALSTEITEKTSLRIRLNAARFTGSIVAGLSGLVIVGFILGYEELTGNKYFLMGKISGLIVFLSIIISCWGLAPFAKTARRPSGKSEPITLQIHRIFKNKKFIKVISLYILLWCALQLMQTVALIYLEDVLKVPNNVAIWVPIPFQISALLGLQLWSRVSNRIGRIVALNYGSLLWIIACTGALFFPSFIQSSSTGIDFLIEGNNIYLFTLLIILISLIGVGASTAYLIPWSLLPDAIDEDPEKPAGLYTAWMVLIQKIGIGLAVQFLGFLLFMSGYKSSLVDENNLYIIEQSQIVLWTIRLCIGFIPSILVMSGLKVMTEWNKKVISN